MFTHRTFNYSVISGAANVRSSAAKNHTIGKKFRQSKYFDARIGVYSVVEPFEFGPTVQRAVLPQLSYDPIPNYTRFYMVGWGQLGPQDTFKYPDDVMARTVFKSSIPVNNVDGYKLDPRLYFWLSYGRDTPVVAAINIGNEAVIDTETGILVGLVKRIISQVEPPTPVLLLTVNLAAQRDIIDQWVRELS